MPDFWVRLVKLYTVLVKGQPESKTALHDMFISYFTELPKLSVLSNQRGHEKNRCGSC